MAKVAGSNPARCTRTMVAVAQLAEPWIVIPVVVGSSPICHPIFTHKELDVSKYEGKACDEVFVRRSKMSTIDSARKVLS